MLILTDSQELGDKRLDPKEGLAKLREDNQKLIDARKLAGQSELEDVQKALGQPMAYQELIRRLKLANSNILALDGGVRGAIQLRIPAVLEDGTQGTKYLTGFYKDVLPEFSYLLTDEKGLATREVRGWRSVLLALLKQKVITQKSADKLFGEALGQRSGRVLAQLSAH